MMILENFLCRALPCRGLDYIRIYYDNDCMHTFDYDIRNHLESIHKIKEFFSEKARNTLHIAETEIFYEEGQGMIFEIYLI